MNLSTLFQSFQHTSVTFRLIKTAEMCKADDNFNVNDFVFNLVQE